MNEESKQRIKSVFRAIAVICALIGTLWGPGRLIFHDIPMLVRGYEEIVVEWEEEADEYGRPRQTAQKTVKHYVEPGEAIGSIFGNLLITFLSVGFWMESLENGKRE